MQTLHSQSLEIDEILMSISAGESAAASAKPLLKHAVDDWKQAAVSGDTSAFVQDLVALRKLDRQDSKNPAQYDHDLKTLNKVLGTEALLPNLQIIAVRHGEIIARDQRRGRNVVIESRPGGLIEVEDTGKNRSSRVSDAHHHVKTRARETIDASKIKPTDVHQGVEINDCRWQARLAALAQADPASIARMIKKNADGTFTVTFPGAPTKPQRITAPTGWERATFSDGGADWPVILTKAYRQLSRQQFGPPRSAVNIEGLLTGRSEALLVFFDLHNCLPVKNIVSHYCQPITNSAVSAQIDKNDKRNIFLARADAGRVLDVALSNHMTVDTAFDPGALKTAAATLNARDSSGRAVDLQYHHYYTVLAYDARQQQVTLRNPWGKNFAAHTAKLTGDGIVRLPLEQFVQVSLGIDIEKTSLSR
jgi:hypothetical protein